MPFTLQFEQSKPLNNRVTELFTGEFRAWIDTELGLRRATDVFNHVRVLNGVSDLSTVKAKREELVIEAQRLRALPSIDRTIETSNIILGLEGAANLLHEVIIHIEPIAQADEVFVIDTLEKLNQSMSLDLINPTTSTVRTVINTLLSSSGIGFVNTIKPTLRQILESLGRNDIIDIDAVSLYRDTIAGRIITPEQIEQFAEPPPVDPGTPSTIAPTLTPQNPFVRDIFTKNKIQEISEKQGNRIIRITLKERISLSDKRRIIG